MKPLITFTALFSLAVVLSCNKDKFPKEPRISYKSIDPKNILQGSAVQVVFAFTDGDGNIGTSGNNQTYVYFNDSRISANRFDSLPFPEIGSETKGKAISGDVVFTIPKVFCSANSFQQDSVRYRIFVRDRDYHPSDTITTEYVHLKCN